MSNIGEVIKHFPSDLQDPILQFWETIKDEIGVKREDFTELKNIVQELAEAQKRTENRVEELAVAQKRTENRVEDLAEAQKDTERSLQRLSNTIDFKIGGLGSRWGVGSEQAFRKGLAEILKETGYQVINYIENDSEGFVFGSSTIIEIDIIINGMRTICVEIKSSVSRSDVYVFMRKAAFYEKIKGTKVDRLLIITPFIDQQARDVAEANNIIVCDSLSNLGECTNLLA